MLFFENIKGIKIDTIGKCERMKSAGSSSSFSSTLRSTYGFLNSWNKCKLTDDHAMKDYKHEYIILYKKLLYERRVIEDSYMIINMSVCWYLVPNCQTFSIIDTPLFWSTIVRTCLSRSYFCFKWPLSKSILLQFLEAQRYQSSNCWCHRIQCQCSGHFSRSAVLN